MLKKVLYGLVLTVSIAHFVYAETQHEPSLEVLFQEAIRPVFQMQMRDQKRLAREAFFAQDEKALTFLLNHIHLENMWVRILADQLVHRMSADLACPILLAYCHSEYVKTRKFSAYFLGYYNTPEYEYEVLKLLDEEPVAGSAMRTLGKWKSRPATKLIMPFLFHHKERYRILAANALRDIVDERAAPALLEALNDKYFTVRYAAERALQVLGSTVEQALLEQLMNQSQQALRHRVRCLGALRSKDALPIIKKLVDHEDWGLAGDAVRAFIKIDSQEARTWAGSQREVTHNVYTIPYAQVMDEAE